MVQSRAELNEHLVLNHIGAMQVVTELSIRSNLNSVTFSLIVVGAAGPKRLC